MNLFEKVDVIKCKEMRPASAEGPNKNCIYNIEVETVVDKPDENLFEGPNENENENEKDVLIGGSCTSYVRVLNDNEIELLKEEQYEKIVNNINFKGLYIWNDDDPNAAFNEAYELTSEDENNMNELNEHFFILTPKTVQIKKDLAPVCIVKISMISGIQLDKPLLCFLDLGSTTTMIQWKALPAGCAPMKSAQKSITTMANGTFNTLMSVNLQDIVHTNRVCQCQSGRQCAGSQNV